MLGSSVLDVAVGMIFMYLLFGILVTAINESISSLLNKRGRNLLEGIKNLLNDPNYTGLAHQIYNHGLIDGISQNASNNKKANRLPSYLPSSSFSLALVDILTTRGALAAAHSSLLVAVEQADDAVFAARQIKNPNAEQSAALAAAQTAQAQAEAALQTSWQQAKTQLDNLQQSLQSKPDDDLAKSQLISAQQQFDLSDAAVKMLAARRAAMQSASNPKKLEQVILAANAAENALAVSRSLINSQLDPLAKIEQALAQLPNGHTKESLYVLLDKTRRELNEGEHAIETLRKNLENWFNESMDRVSGWYKRWSQKIGLVLATVLVVVCNFDSLQLAQRLMNDGALRTALANTATDFARDVSNAEPVPSPASAAPAAAGSEVQASGETTATPQQNQISATGRKKMLDLVSKDMNLPIGWNLEKDFEFLKPPGVANTAANATVSADKNVAASDTTAKPLTHTEWIWKILAKVLGLGISIFAVSLGAPFWFDFLMKFVNMRSTGKRPATDVK